MKKVKNIVMATTAAIALAVGVSFGLTHSQKADVVYTNAKIFTSDVNNPWAEAVALKGDKILYVGNQDKAIAYVGKKTEVQNLEGKVVLPGMVSGHEHPFMVAAFASGLQLEQSNDKEKMLAAVKEYVATHPEGPFFSVGGAFEGTLDISKEEIDEIISDKPFLMIGTGIHGGWANSKALEVAGIEKGKEDPVYYFVRNKDGEPTGEVGAAKAMVHMFKSLNSFTEAGIAAKLPDILDTFASIGLTTVFDAGVPNAEEIAFNVASDMEKKGELNVRLVGSIFTQDPAMNEGAVAKAKKYIPLYSSDMFDVNTFKIHNDGNVEGRTAGMLEAYTDKPGEFGSTFQSEAQMTEMVRLASEEGWNVHVHAVGDRTIREVLNAFEKARNAGYSKPRFSTGHTMVIHPEDLPRFAANDVVGNVMAEYSACYIQANLDRLGTERFSTYQPNGLLLKHGAKISMSGDWPASSPNPFAQAYTCIERKMPGDEKSQGIEDTKMNMEQVIVSYTIDAAYQLGFDDIVGSIKAGKKADLVILDRDIFEVSSEEILQTQVLSTLVNGKVVYEKNGELARR